MKFRIFLLKQKTEEIKDARTQIKKQRKNKKPPKKRGKRAASNYKDTAR